MSENQKELFKTEEKEERRFFANKKANIAFGIAFAVMIVVIAALAIWVKL